MQFFLSLLFSLGPAHSLFLLFLFLFFHAAQAQPAFLFSLPFPHSPAQLAFLSFVSSTARPSLAAGPALPSGLVHHPRAPYLPFTRSLTGGARLSGSSSSSTRTHARVRLSHQVFKDKTECITICMPGSSSIHIVTSSVNNQQQYHEIRTKRLQNYQSYTAYPGNEDYKLHWQSTGGCTVLELSSIFKELHVTFSSEQQL
jgi:hypothetical protein